MTTIPLSSIMLLVNTDISLEDRIITYHYLVPLPIRDVPSDIFRVPHALITAVPVWLHQFVNDGTTASLKPYPPLLPLSDISVSITLSDINHLSKTIDALFAACLKASVPLSSTIKSFLRIITPSDSFHTPIPRLDYLRLCHAITEITFSPRQIERASFLPCLSPLLLKEGMR